MQRPNKMNLQRTTTAVALKETGKLISTDPQCSYCRAGVAGLRQVPPQNCQAGCPEQRWTRPYPSPRIPKGSACQLLGVKRLRYQLPSYVLLTAVKVILFQHYISYLLPTCRHVNDLDLVRLLTLLFQRRVKNVLNSLADELVTTSHRDCSDICDDK